MKTQMDQNSGEGGTTITWSFWRTRDWSARRAAVKYPMDAVNYPMDAAGYSLPTEIYYLSQVLVTRNMQEHHDSPQNR